MKVDQDVSDAIELAFREQSGRVMSYLVGHFGGDFQLAEDAFQEALLIALKTWPKSGIPSNPGAWIATTAKRKVIDVLRRQKVYQKKTELLKSSVPDSEEPELWEEDFHLPDDRLRLIFTCCHPALAEEARVALTLRTVAGLKTNEIAASFLVPETTMAQRLVRCKRKIKQAGIPYRVPPAHLLQERLDSVLAVLYLIFNEGYDASTGEALVRHDLCNEAIRLARILNELLPGKAESLGLLALMLLQDSRRKARVDAQGDLVTLEEQDRSLWDRQQIEQGEKLLEQAMRLKAPGPYQIQAAIADLHCQAPTAEETDWPQITALYGRLYQLCPTPVIALNRVVAIAMADGPNLGLRLLEDLASEKPFKTYRWYHAAKADLNRRAGRLQEALQAYEATLELTQNEVERKYLRRRIKELG